MRTPDQFQFFRRAPNWVVAAMVVVFVVLQFRNAGLYPRVFWDEWTFSRMARHGNLVAAEMPVYGYLALYRFTNYCGAGFLECARILNTIFFVAAAPFIYMMCRRVTSGRVSALVAILVLIGPGNTYTIYFMPESMHFFSFWVFSWFLTGSYSMASMRHAWFAGLLAGIMWLVKVHAIFVLPAAVVLIGYRAFQAYGHATPAWNAIRSVCIFLAATIGFRLMAGYTFAGEAGLNVFGRNYGTHAIEVGRSGQYWQLGMSAIESLKWHLVALALLFGIPVASMLLPAPPKPEPDASPAYLLWLQMYSLLLVSGLLIVTAVFSASVIPVFDFESSGKLHARYYNFALPLLFILVAGLAADGESRFRVARTGVPAALVVGCAIYAWAEVRTSTSASVSRYPELWGIAASGTGFNILCLLGIASVIAWAIDQRRACAAYVYVLLPLNVFVSTWFLVREVRDSNYAGVYDRAGMFARANLTERDRARTAVVATDRYGLKTARALFHIDNPGAIAVHIPEWRRFDGSLVPAGTQWALLVGANEVAPEITHRTLMNGFALLHLPGSILIDFSLPAWPGVVTGTQGLGPSSPQGARSTEKRAALEFSSPLPRRLVVSFRAAAFGPNVGRQFFAVVGNERKAFRLAANLTDVTVEFDNNAQEAVFAIEIPIPVSEHELGVGQGDRKYGLRIAEMRIREASVSGGPR